MAISDVIRRRRGKTTRSPRGHRVALGESGVSAKDPFRGHTYLKRYSSYLGQWDPESISLQTMLKMLSHPAVALAEHVIWAPLVHADWDIECPDEDKREFMKAVLRPIYLKMMLYSLPAISLGFAAFTKQWGQGIPYSLVGESLWPERLIRRDIYPVIPVDLKQLDPLTVRPLVDDDEFKGIYQDGWGEIEPLYSMWITHHRHKVWGNLWGWPLLRNVYSWWWSSGFRQGLLNRHIEDRVSPPLLVDYPPGEAEDPNTGEKVYNRQAALETGQAVRAGETVAMPSEWYFDENGKPYGRKWDARFLSGGENAQAFVELEDASDVRILMGMLIPPQALLQAKGGIGSQSVAETLGEVFWVSQRIRKQELDQQISDYVLEPIERLNWPDGPRCRLVTTRFRREDQAMIGELLKIVANRQDVDVASMFDLQSMLRRTGVPEGDVANVTKQAGEGDAADD